MALCAFDGGVVTRGLIDGFDISPLVATLFALSLLLSLVRQVGADGYT